MQETNENIPRSTIMLSLLTWCFLVDILHVLSTLHMVIDICSTARSDFKICHTNTAVHGFGALLARYDERPFICVFLPITCSPFLPFADTFCSIARFFLFSRHCSLSQSESESSTQLSKMASKQAGLGWNACAIIPETRYGNHRSQSNETYIAGKCRSSTRSDRKMPKLIEVGLSAGKLLNLAQPLEMTHATRIRIFRDTLI